MAGRGSVCGAERAPGRLDDGGGDGDQNFEIYLGDRARVGGKKDFLEYIDVRFTNFGFVYTELAIYVREVNPEGKNMSRFPLHLAGKVMGYCALGKVRKAWKAAVRDMYNGFTSPDDVPVLLGPNPTVQDERDLAATSQDVLEELMEETDEEEYDEDEDFEDALDDLEDF